MSMSGLEYKKKYCIESGSGEIPNAIFPEPANIPYSHVFYFRNRTFCTSASLRNS